MKRFLLIAMLMLALPSLAQNYDIRLSRIYSEDGYESREYVYAGTDNANLVCINEITKNIEIIDSLFYDERGNIAKITTWWKIGDVWECSGYADYTYNEKDLRISRTLYEIWDDGFIYEHASYKYNYNENGQMIEWILSLSGIEFQKVIISYNDKGQKESELMLYNYDFDANNSFEESYLIEYEYDENDNCVRENGSNWNGDMWELSEVREYEYDENGNCIVSERKTQAGTVAENAVYTYDTSVLVDNVYCYSDPEGESLLFPKANKNMLMSYTYNKWGNEEDIVYNFEYEMIDIAVPTNLVAEATSDSTILLTWDKAENVMSYNIYSADTMVANVTETSYLISGLEYDTEYCYTVSAVRNEKESEKSEEVCTKTFDLPITMPTNLVAEALSVSSISLSWNEVENALSYNVYRNNEFVTNVANPAYTDNDLEYDTEYCYMVSAVRNETESEKTEEVCIKTLGESIEELSSSISVYPNPVNDKLYIETEFEVEEVVVYDMFGRCQVTETPSHQGNLSIDVTDLTGGVYFVKVATENVTFVKRIVKN